jgi:DNA-binding NtrC family response regulator
VDPEAQAILLSGEWPGNVRELENVLERALVLAELDVIGPEHLPQTLQTAAAAHPGLEVEQRGVPTVRPRASTLPGDENMPLEEIERLHVIRVLGVTRGNREEAARILGISRRTLSRMVRRWGIPPRRG